MKLKRVLAREWLFFLLLLFLSPGVLSVYHWVKAPKTSEEIPEEHPRLYDLLVTAPGYDAQLLIVPNSPKSKRDQEILDFVIKHSPREFSYTLSNTVNPRTGEPYELKSRQRLNAEDLDSIKQQLINDEKERNIVPYEKLPDQLKSQFRINKNEYERVVVTGSGPQWKLSDHFIPDSPKDGLNQIGEFVAGGYLTSDDRILLSGLKANGFLIFKKRPLFAYFVDAIKEPDKYFEAIIVVYPLFWFIRSIVWSVRKLMQREA